MNKILVSIFCFFVFLSCSKIGNPHYLKNNAVREVSRMYSPDSTKFILTYVLDVGARGERDYQALIKKGQENNALDDYLIPWQFSNLRWVDNNNIVGDFDVRAEATYTDIDVTKENQMIYGVTFHINKK